MPSPAAGNPATLYSTGLGQQHVFYRGTDNNIYQVFYDENSGVHHSPEQWTSSSDVIGDPATLYSTGLMQQHIFYRDTHNNIWHVFYDENSGVHHSPEQWDTGALGDPVTMYTPNQQHIFYQKYGERMGGTGQGINIWHVFYDENSGVHHSPEQWLPVGAPVAWSKPATMYTPNGQQHVFYRGPGNNIYQVFFDPNGRNPHGPETWAPNAVDNLATMYTPNGQQHVFYLTIFANGGISHVFYDPGSNRLHGPEVWPVSLGYDATGDPATMYTPNGQQHVFYRTIDNGIYQDFFDPNSGSNPHGPEQWASNAASNPATMYSTGLRQQHVFYRGIDNNIWQVFYDENSGVHHSPEQWTFL